MIVAGIVGAEAAYWVVLGLALVARYPIRWRGVSAVLLWSLPAIDAALLAFVAADLARGAEPTQAHAFAASYLGFTIAFGHPLVRWADRTFAQWFAGAPRAAKPAKGSAAHVRALWIEWFRVVLAVAIAVAILAGLAFGIRHEPVPASFDQATTDPLWAQAVLLGLVVVGWFFAGPAFARRTSSLA